MSTLKVRLLLLSVVCIIIIGTGVESRGIAPAPVTCDCSYSAGGCTISTSPRNGYKCKCIFKGFWTCKGLAIQCDAGQSCPGGCSSNECCNTGGGDCGGY